MTLAPFDPMPRLLRCVGCLGHETMHTRTSRHIFNGSAIDWYRCTACHMPRSVEVDVARGTAPELAATDAAALLACFPPGVLAEVAAVLREGAAAKGCAPHETGGGQTREDHLAHALDHVHGASVGDTSEPHIDHAIARLVLARGLELAGSEG